MSVIDLFRQLRPEWLTRIAAQLAPADDVRETFDAPLNQFYDLLLRAVEGGDPACLDALLAEWVEARTQRDLDDPDNNLQEVLARFLQQMFAAAHATLSDAQALRVVEAMLPVYTYAIGYATRYETELHVQHVSSELSRAQLAVERLEKSKSDFISIAAHELKTPLTLIEGYISMLKEMIPDSGVNEQNALFIKGIHSGTRRLREIVDDMIDVSMIDNNLLSLTFQPVWLNRLLSVLDREFTPVARERNITLVMAEFPGSTEMNFGDGERLLQAFRNVISNAIKYTPDGGAVTVNGRLLPGFVEVTVRDTGIGIDPAHHSRIFEKFGGLGDVSLHSSGKTKFKGGGPGLGLPITKGIIESHGGAIWVESLGYDEITLPGSIFHILLPLRKAPPDDKSAKLFAPAAERTV